MPGSVFNRKHYTYGVPTLRSWQLFEIILVYRLAKLHKLTRAVLVDSDIQVLSLVGVPNSNRAAFFAAIKCRLAVSA
jgi:hypothetical protein